MDKNCLSNLEITFAIYYTIRQIQGKRFFILWSWSTKNITTPNNWHRVATNKQLQNTIKLTHNSNIQITNPPLLTHRTTIIITNRIITIIQCNSNTLNIKRRNNKWGQDLNNNNNQHINSNTSNKEIILISNEMRDCWDKKLRFQINEINTLILT